MRRLFTATIFFGSFLLFLVQPMIAKMLLPAFGGAPAVWSTCLVFFQGVLLFGYGYANRAPRLLPHRTLVVIHTAFFALAAWILFQFGFASGAQISGTSPGVADLLLFLAYAVGLPYLLVSTGAPLLQRWYAEEENPYFLYAASNAGSLLGLFAYPFGVERFFSLPAQARYWGVAFVALGALVTVCGLITKSGAAKPAPPASPPIASSTKLRWFLLSAVPSSLLIGATTYLTANVAAIPLLWIIPLALYLVTFIIAFRRKGPPNSQKLFRYAALLMAPMALMLVLEASDPIILLAIFHLSVFGLGALACHSELAETRPDADRLTEFYFVMSLGGVAGGAFNALLAPVAFNGAYEYPIALIVLLLLRSREDRPTAKDAIGPLLVTLFTLAVCLVALGLKMDPGRVRTAVTIGLPALTAFLLIDRARRYALALAGVLLVAHFLGINRSWKLIASERSFFGVHRILESPSGKFRSLVHGVTIHGRQAPGYPEVPLTYYHPTGPLGMLIKVMQGKQPSLRAGLVGLGVGSIAAYARPNDHFTYFEIDPVVVDLAENPKFYTYLSNAKGKVDIVLGDARLSLQNYNEKYDLIVLDAFSSDAIPIHLLTKEAVEMYFSRLRPGGILAFHISNRFLSLNRVLAKFCDELKVPGRYGADGGLTTQEKDEGKEPSQYFLMAKTEGDLKIAPRQMFDPIADIKRAPLWTDTFSNLLDVWGYDDPYY